METKHIVIRLALALAALSAAFSARAEREIFSLNGAWEFRRGDAAAELVNLPHSWNTDGSLALVHPYDWCSGFFPGSLWQVYEYTRDPYWRRQAISFTWPVEEAKWHGGTHDIGFMVNDSFGRAYAMTGERSYLEAVMRRDTWPQLNL